MLLFVTPAADRNTGVVNNANLFRPARRRGWRGWCHPFQPFDNDLIYDLKNYCSDVKEIQKGGSLRESFGKPLLDR